jgi:Tfp pilus assembly protein PilV
MKLKNKKYQGFSFIDSILAIFILSVGIITVLELMSSSIRVSLEAKNYNIAVSLAQEGAELVRNVRDNSWSSFSSLISGSKSNCKIDINSSSISDCNNGNSVSNRRLYLDSNGFYTHTAGSGTRFYRKIGLSKNGNDEYEVTSMVIWGGNSFPSISSCDEANHCTYTQVTLKNWK